jgi:deoxycytidylate deaminase
MPTKLQGFELEKAIHWLRLSQKKALNSKCLRHNGRCGAMITRNGESVGWGWNSPPQNRDIKACRKDAIRQELKETGKKFKSDLSCCVHAEMRAMTMAIVRSNRIDFHNCLEGCRLYFIRIDDEGDCIPSGHPWCTQCSKFALDIGISEWVLWHGESVWDKGKGVYLYDANEYNEISYQYRG